VLKTNIASKRQQRNLGADMALFLGMLTGLIALGVMVHVGILTRDTRGPGSYWSEVGSLREELLRRGHFNSAKLKSLRARRKSGVGDLGA
jgi:hypothetical protein